MVILALAQTIEANMKIENTLNLTLILAALVPVTATEIERQNQQQRHYQNKKGKKKMVILALAQRIEANMKI